DTTAVACKSFTWNRDGVTYTQSQVVDYRFTNVQGCKDTVTLHLTINNGVHTDTTVVACKSFTWNRNNVTYTSNATVDYEFDNAQGCKDTVTLHLTINNGVHTDTTVVACKSFTWNRNNVTYTSAATVDYIFDNAQGCKDTVTLHLTINNGVHTDTTVVACKSFTWNHNNVTYTGNATVDYEFDNAQGCKDTVTLHLTINNGVHTDTTVVACKSFTWNHNNVTYTGNATVDYEFDNAQGCKDTVTLHLTINNGVHTDTTVVACKSFTWNRNSVTYTGNATVDYEFDNAQGCKDTVTLHLTINNGVHTDTTVVACKSFTWNRNNVTYTGNATVDYEFDNAQGCKDTVTLHLTINNGVHTDTTVVACKSFTWNRNNQTYASNATVDYTFAGANGCEDTVTLHLTINNGVHTDTTVVSCKSFTWNRDGVTYTQSQVVDYRFTNAQGCEDTVTLHLTINSGAHTD